MDQLLFELNPNPVLIYDTGSLKIRRVNKAFLEKYGYTESEIDQLTIKDIRPKDKVKKLEKILADLDEEGINESKVVQHQSKEGDIFYVKVSSHAYSENDQELRMVVIHDVTERVEAEQKARQAFEELNHHVNHSPLAMIKWDKNFKVIEWSKRAEEMTGFKEKAALGKTPRAFRFYSDEDLEVVNKNIELLISGEKEKSKFEIQMYRKNNTLAHFSVHASALRDENDLLISVLTFVEDITDQKKTELRYQRLFENANDGIFLMKKDCFVECNDEVTNIYGCDRKDILGSTPLDFSPEYQPDGQLSSKKALHKINKALDGTPQVFEWKHQKMDGTPVDTEVSLNRLELADEVYVQAIVRDLTEQKKAQEKLRKSEKLFRKLFLKAPGAMVMIDPENRVKKVNQSFEELFGYTQKELLGKDIDEVIVEDGKDQVVPRMPGKEFREGKFFTDITRHTKSGRKLNLLLGAIPVYLDDKPIAGFGIYVDITEQKEYQRKLQQSLKEKQVLLEEIHHRVKNNLAIISGLLQLQAFESEEEETRSTLHDSQLRIQSMALVHEMLYQSENFTDISFKTYLNKLIDTIKTTLPFDHQHININIQTEDISMDINQAIPCAILVNELVTNAYKHGFRNQESGTIKVELREGKEQNIISVEDDGIGLPEDFQISEQSSIGMNLIQNLTKQLSGTLDVHSKNGSYFEIRFDKTKERGSSTLHMLKDK